MKRIACAAALLAASGAAFGQCTIRRDNVPDLDQRRSSLPNNGSMYCFPTAAINWMAYIANHGFPQAMAVSSPRDWQSNLSYGIVAARLSEMGQLMDTSASGGTTGGDARDGIAAYLGLRGLPFFTVNNWHGEISPMSMYLHMAGGGLVSFCYGRYSQGSSGYYSRNGGHCVTLTTVYNACTSTPFVVFRDPASDGNLAGQSAFSSVLSAAVRVYMPTGIFSGKTRWQLVHLGQGEPSKRCVDSMIVIRPLVALTASAHRAGELVTLRPVLLEGSDLPPQSAAEVPGGGAITDVALLPSGIEAVVASHAPGGLRRLWRYTIPTGEFTQAWVCESGLSAAATSRFGEVYIWCDGAVSRLELHEGGDTSTLGDAPAPEPIDALAYDDARDELVGVSAAGARLVRYSRELDTIMDSALPAVQLTGDVSLAIDEAAQRYLIAGSGGPTIFELAVVPGGPVQLVGEINLPAVQSPAGLQFNDQGNLVVIHDGGIAEFARTPDGGWAPLADSPLAGLEAHGVLAVARSRTDFIPGVHDTPEWNNVLIENEGEERPECRADWDRSASVNSQDIAAYLSAWLASVQAGTADADFNADGAVSSSDISAFLSAWLEDVATGCW